jgi:site-specific DNA-methyltransferase (adenine-specific)
MIRLHNCDCMEFMRGLPDKAYDLAIVDPPYGMKGLGAQDGGSSNKKHLAFHNGSIDCWDVAPGPEYFEELRRVSVDQIIWGGNYFPLPPTRCVIVWDKVQVMAGYFSQVEIGWTSFSHPTRLFQFRNTYDGKIHPTQKPVALYRWLLQNYAKPGQKILDTHGGSMSSAIACDIEGYDLDLCELDKDYFEAGKKRLEQHQAQPRMFAPEPVKSSTQLSIEQE